MQIERTPLNTLVENPLPDGSRVIVDSGNETVFALNATAAAAWDACSDPTTLSGVTERLRSSFGPAITEELAENAVLQLQEQNLVTTSGASSGPTRRKVLATLSAVAIPLVISMTMADQRAHACQAKSTDVPGEQFKKLPDWPPKDSHHHDPPVWPLRPKW
jgi:hypothetical protein